ncbi:hypothetical protein EXIGLDRAFT_721993 [Exidia glandulosa HHB12029]|uniref:Uncharacterized protein n=1 Tax=Exidia glandulosa HHB12029 TaxID=1314781 RepID=A0A165FJZ2_EXIGL|nr:hypothetical protein EXIGLDRAFT_721993 [Exidia glandulosa HHB12029]
MDPLAGAPQHLALFCDLAGSNREPTKQERRDINAVLAAVSNAHSRQLADLRTREAEANRALAIVTLGHAEPDQVRAALEQYNSCVLARSIAEDHPLSTNPAYRLLQTIIHPIRSIPPNILALIFQRAVDDAAGTASTAYDRAIAWRLAAVSASWRRVALRTHVIWRLVTLDLSKLTLDYRAWLLMVTHRAGVAVLFDVRVEGDDMWGVSNNGIMDAILEYLPARRNVKVVLDIDDNVHRLCNLYTSDTQDAASTSQVEEVQFVGAQFPCFPPCQSHTPNLRRVTVSLCQLQGPFRWETMYGVLRTYRSEIVPVQHVTLRPSPQRARVGETTRLLIRTFQTFPKATVFDLHMHDVQPISPTEEGLCLKHHEVQHLRIEYDRQLHILADSYSFPALRDVTFRCTHMMTIPPGLIHMLRHAFAAVRTLRIIYEHETLIDNDFAAALGEMSELQSLEMTKCSPATGFFRALAQPGKCPALGTLKLRDTLISTDDVSYELLGFIEGRRDAANRVARIQHLEAIALTPASFAVQLASALA